MSASGRLGLVVGVKAGALRVVRVSEGTPGHRAGLRAGDRIARIDDDETANMDRKAAAARLKGPPGTPVVLWITREGASPPARVELVREASPETAMPDGIGRFVLGLVGILVVVGIIVAITWSSTAPHRDGAMAYARLVRDGQLRAAYERLANERKAALSYDAWLGAMNTPLLARAKSVSVSSTSSNSTGHGCVRAAVSADDDTVALTFFTVLEDEQVHIQSVMTNDEQSGLLSRAPWSCN